MRPLLLHSLAAAALCAWCAAARADSWAGKRIMLKRPGARIGHTDKATGRQVYDATLTDMMYEVLREQAGWLRVRHRGVEGWLDKDAAVLLENAIDHFTNHIRRSPEDAYAYAHRGAA